MRSTRRIFLQVVVTGLVGGFTKAKPSDGLERPTNRRLHFVQIDVFASERLQGNPLAVFTDARGLSDTQMQSIAREVNHGDKITSVRVGGHAVEVAQGEYALLKE
jgi:predicted PhzF superfamily epimerase YddE/YHI9